MNSVSASSAVDRGFESPPPGETKLTFAVSPLSMKYILRSINKEWLVQNLDNVSDSGDFSNRGFCCLFQWISTVRIQLSVLV